MSPNLPIETITSILARQEKKHIHTGENQQLAQMMDSNLRQSLDNGVNVDQNGNLKQHKQQIIKAAKENVKEVSFIQ